MNFIELVREVKAESGRLTSGPASVVGATGRDQLIAGWVRAAWRQIQSMPRHWRWKRRTASAALVVGDGSYLPADLGAESFSYWAPDSRSYAPRVAPADAPQSYSWLKHVDYETFQSMYLVPGVQGGVPQHWTESPEGALLLGPTPDRALTISIDYYRGLQDLQGDADIPDMPEAHHSVIMWRALEQTGRFDTAPDVVDRAVRNYRDEFAELLRRQTDEPITSSRRP